MDFDIRKVAENIRGSTTEELLDRVTVYREEMEPAAVDLIENELARRGQTPEAIAEHGRARRGSALVESHGLVARCAFCDRPAVTRAWTRHRPHSRIRIFPMRLYFCDVHAAEYRIV